MDSLVPVLSVSLLVPVFTCNAIRPCYWKDLSYKKPYLQIRMISASTHIFSSQTSEDFKNCVVNTGPRSTVRCHIFSAWWLLCQWLWRCLSSARSRQALQFWVKPTSRLLESRRNHKQPSLAESSTPFFHRGPWRNRKTHNSLTITWIYSNWNDHHAVLRNGGERRTDALWCMSV